MDKIRIEGTLENRDIEIAKVCYDLDGVFDAGKISFTEEDELNTMVTIEKKNNIVELVRENEDAIITFYFSKEENTIGVYHLKAENLSFDMNIYTEEMTFEEGKIYINYNLEIENENAGVFELDLIWR